MSRIVDRLSLVYDARGGVVGELAYAIGRARGTRHCALCGLTHGRARERPAWREFRSSLPVPVRAFHLNDRPDDVAAASGGSAPAVVAHTGGEAIALLDRKQLERIGGDLDAFGAELDGTLLATGLAWPSG
ncbi:MAG: hypothetical protein MSC30_16390 [Gaiellaceae bacterium MAG52_C11]|nr:hypothetical protein [Candidatus Gaiellasilicea maunaloa]